jgi:hypothetical protein
MNNLSFSVQPLCSLCLRGDGSLDIHHRDTEKTEIAQRLKVHFDSLLRKAD